MVFYGSLRGRNERMPIGYWLGQFPGSSLKGVGKSEFGAG